MGGITTVLGIIDIFAAIVIWFTWDAGWLAFLKTIIIFVLVLKGIVSLP